MKHLDYSDKTKGLTGLKGLIVLTFSVFLSFSPLLTSCGKYDEVDFAGIIIDTRECTLSYTRPDLGYLVELENPTCLLYLHDRIKGAFYLDNDYPHAHCSIHWNDIDDIPVGVFTAVSVD